MALGVIGRCVLTAYPIEGLSLSVLRRERVLQLRDIVIGWRLLENGQECLVLPAGGAATKTTSVLQPWLLY